MLEFGIRIDPKSLQKLEQKMARYQQALVDASLVPVKEAAEIYCQIVISHMGQHVGNEMVFSDTWWKELSDKWLGEKKALGLVEEIWEATGETKRYVQVHSAQRIPDGWIIFAGLRGVPPNVLLKALENEFGSDVFEGMGATPGVTMYIVPARPLFEPAKREMLHSPFHRQMMVAGFAKAVKQAYKVATYDKR